MDTITEATRTPEQVWDGKVTGLYELSDWLRDHPDVAVPEIETIWLYSKTAIVQFLHGLDELPIDGEVTPDTSYVRLARRFEGITLTAYAPKKLLGDFSFTPWTVDQVRNQPEPTDEAEGPF